MQIEEISYIIGYVEDFEGVSDLDQQRHSLDGTKVLMELIYISKENFEDLRYSSSVAFMSESQARVILQSSEWSIPE